MHYLILLAVAVGLFLSLPWLAVAFGRYCNAVNRTTQRRAPQDGAVCAGYRAPRTAENSGFCGRCGMADYKHQETPDA